MYCSEHAEVKVGGEFSDYQRIGAISLLQGQTWLDLVMSLCLVDYHVGLAAHVRRIA